MDSTQFTESFINHFETFKSLFRWLLGFTFFATFAAMRGLRAVEYLGVKIQPQQARISAYFVQSLMLSLMLLTLGRMNLIVDVIEETERVALSQSLSLDSWPLNPFLALSDSIPGILISGLSCMMFGFCYAATFYPAYLFTVLPSAFQAESVRRVSLFPVFVTLILIIFISYLYWILPGISSLSFVICRLVGSLTGLLLAWGILKSLYTLSIFNYEKHLVAEAYGGKTEEAIKKTYGLEDDD